MKKKILLLGYGNPNREDDGVAWHVLKGIAEGLGLTVPGSPDDPFDKFEDRIELLFVLQLVPEISEIISQIDEVCFIDAHTGEINAGVRAIEIGPKFQNSPFTHHLTPQSCLELVNSIYHRTPRGFLVSIRGFSFQFEENLSAETDRLSKLAVDLILEWIRSGKFVETVIS
jgi:hydrogenase maturation protease